MSDLAILTGNDETLADGAHVWAQGVAADEGFKNVSRRWYEQTTDYDAGFEHLESERGAREDITFDRDNVQFALNGADNFVVKIGGREFIPTSWAARQLSKWYKVPETLTNHFIDGDADDVNLLCDVFDNANRKLKGVDDEEGGKNLKFRTYSDGTLRAVLSEQYSIVDNRWYLEVLKELIPGGRLSHFNRSDADTIYGNILIPDTIREEQDSDYGGMVSIGNCEIGKRKVSQYPSIYRAICLNGCIWGKTAGMEYTKRHRGIVLDELRAMIITNINRQIPLMGVGVDKLLATRTLPITSAVYAMFAAIVNEHNLNKNVANSAVTQWEAQGKEKTCFGIIDAITRGGQEHDETLWIATDEVAGKIMAGGASMWEKLNATASSLSEDKIVKLLGI